MDSAGLPVTRRSFLQSGAAGVVALHAGCLGSEGSPSTGGEDGESDGNDGGASGRSRRVYIPPHFHEAKAADSTRAGDYAVSLLYSSPDFFWRVDGSRAEQIEPTGEESMQLIAWLWAPETGVVLPGAGVTATVEQDGNVATETELLPMLTQRRGVHYAQNITLETYGEYTVGLQIDGIDTRRTRGFAGRFGSATAELALPFDRGQVGNIATTYLEQAGNGGAVKPLKTDGMPLGVVDPSGLPGEVVATGTSGGAGIAVLSVGAGESPLDDGRPYLAVVPTTPFNRFLLPLMRVEGRLTRGGSPAFEGELATTLDPDLGYHYGAGVDSIRTDDVLRLSFPQPPQIARFAGYEQAFLDMDELELSL